VSSVVRNGNQRIYKTIKEICMGRAGMLSQCVKVENLQGKRTRVVLSNTLKQVLQKMGCVGWQIGFDSNEDMKKLLSKPTMAMVFYAAFFVKVPVGVRVCV